MREKQVRQAPTRDDILAELPRLRRYARVLASGAPDADELVVAALERAWQRGGRLARTTGLRTWLFALVRDEATGRAVKPGLAALGYLDAAAAGPLARLPADEAEVLMLVAAEGLRYGEVARLTRMPVASVIATLGRARSRVRAMS